MGSYTHDPPRKTLWWLNEPLRYLEQPLLVILQLSLCEVLPICRADGLGQRLRLLAHVLESGQSRWRHESMRAAKVIRLDCMLSCQAVISLKTIAHLFVSKWCSLECLSNLYFLNLWKFCDILAVYAATHNWLICDNVTLVKHFIHLFTLLWVACVTEAPLHESKVDR